MLGPDGQLPAAATNSQVAWPAFRDATLDVHDYLRKHGRVPARVYIGAEALPPADFLTGLAFTFQHYHQDGRLPATNVIPMLTNLELRPAHHLANDTPELFGGWIIHRAGFRAPSILAVARLQAWTLKPAIRKK